MAKTTVCAVLILISAVASTVLCAITGMFTFGIVAAFGYIVFISLVVLKFLKNNKSKRRK